MTPLEFFDGRITGFGAVLGLNGKVARRFEIEAHGQWSLQDRAFQLDETYRYLDGEGFTRRWSIHGDEEGVLVGYDADTQTRMRGRPHGRDFRLVFDQSRAHPDRRLDRPRTMDFIETGPNDRILNGRATLLGLPIATIHMALRREPHP